MSDAAGRADRGLAARLAEFAAAVDGHTREVLDAAALPPELDGMVRYHLGWVDQRFQPVEAPRGKYLRPALCLLVAEADGADWRAALGSAAAIELIHNFSLVHDDIEDDSLTRRHRPTLWALWGVAQAINAGDTLLVLAQLAILGDAGGGPLAGAGARLLNRACLDLCAGQYRDLAAPLGAEPSLDGYLTMIGGKTAALLRAAAELGALAAGAPAATQAAYGRFGGELGMAFQLQDDLLDIWGSETQTGKPSREDVRSRKLSLPIVLACHLAAPATRARLRALYQQPSRLTDDTVAEVVATMEALGVHDEAERLVHCHHAAAMTALEQAAAQPEPAARLRALATSLLGRQA